MNIESLLILIKEVFMRKKSLNIKYISNKCKE